VEDGLHWVLDVIMNEDQARSRKDNGPQNIALLRRLPLNLAKLEGSKEALKGKLFRAAPSDVFLTRLLIQFAKTQMRQRRVADKALITSRGQRAVLLREKLSRKQAAFLPEKTPSGLPSSLHGRKSRRAPFNRAEPKVMLQEV